MNRQKIFRMLIQVAVLFSLTGFIFLSGCTKRPSKEELSALDEASRAAKAAEEKLDGLRRERMGLEKDLDEKKERLRYLEEQRDEIKRQLEEKAE